VNARFLGNAASWHQGGIEDIAVNTDSPVVPQHELSYQASMAVRHGLPEELAMKGLTINPARMIGIDKRVGSLEPGKDADVILWTGSPLDVRNYVALAIVNGEVVYDIAKDRRRF
jgi:imidazolonepropionase-like amidohydrolase